MHDLLYTAAQHTAAFVFFAPAIAAALVAVACERKGEG